MNKRSARFFTQKELWRIIDLANRRVVDNGEKCYSIEDQKLFIKMRKVLWKWKF